MNKYKVIMIIVAILTVIGIGLAIAIDKESTPAENVSSLKDLGSDVELDAGTEESVFDEETSAGETTTNETTTSEQTDDSQTTVSKRDDMGADDSQSYDTQSNNSNDNSNDMSIDISVDEAIKNPSKVDYESFHAMDPSDQQKFMESFDDLDAFFDWYNDVKAEYEKEHPSIEVDGGAVDLDKLD